MAFCDEVAKGPARLSRPAVEETQKRGVMETRVRELQPDRRSIAAPWPLVGPLAETGGIEALYPSTRR